MWSAADLHWPLRACVHFTIHSAEIACTWLCREVSLSIPFPRQVPLQQVSEKLCCSAGISRNKCPQAGLGCKITVCEAFKTFHVYELMGRKTVNRKKPCRGERANRQSADISIQPWAHLDNLWVFWRQVQVGWSHFCPGYLLPDSPCQGLSLWNNYVYLLAAVSGGWQQASSWHFQSPKQGK